MQPHLAQRLVCKPFSISELALFIRSSVASISSIYLFVVGVAAVVVVLVEGLVVAIAVGVGIPRATAKNTLTLCKNNAKAPV